MSFDIAGLELYLPLIVGAKVVIAPRDAAMDGFKLAVAGPSERRSCRRPRHLALLLEGGFTARRTKRAVRRRGAAARTGRAALTVRELWNMYGPTETTIWSSCTCHAASDPPRFGGPIANTRFYVLDSSRPTGADRSARRAPHRRRWRGRGYHNRPELTGGTIPDKSVRPSAAACTAPAISRAGAGRHNRIPRAHRSPGQTARLPHRTGRNRGRARAQGVAKAVVTCARTIPGDRRLVAYVRRPQERGRAPRGARLPEAVLPAYMVPSLFVLSRCRSTPTGRWTDGAAAPGQRARRQRPRSGASAAARRRGGTWSRSSSVCVLGVERGRHHRELLRSRRQLAAGRKDARPPAG